MTDTAARTLRVRWLGRVRYQDGHALQKALHRRSGDDHLLLLEHPHVFTLGVRADLEHVTVLHLGMSEDYCTGGMNDDVGLLLRLMGEVRRSSRRMKGVRRLEVLYGGQRSRAVAL